MLLNRLIQLHRRLLLLASLYILRAATRDTRLAKRGRRVLLVGWRRSNQLGSRLGFAVGRIPRFAAGRLLTWSLSSHLTTRVLPGAFATRVHSNTL